ncbi:hypothetical protein ABZ516_32570 [Streptomyces sp. NPDC019826]|uniref:hypothetical protein n=1 Tax=Streptomyces TaxID=1883 RepID=UPI0029B464EB|nr:MULTISPECIES: hypothetical protein [unclassified Streptomyces]MDX3186624.1 hypothetical protein [Streptomyces sp. ME02-7008A-1]MDX3307354.1 hypothetical protein [Streptomyces sp. ME02-7008A]
MTSPESFAGLDGPEPDDGLPPLLRRPEAVADPQPVARLRRARKALLDHPEVSLDEEAANVVTSGAVDPVLLQALVAVEPVSLLTAKPVVGGTLHVTAPHSRYLDLDVLPDIINQRWADQLPTAMDPVPSTFLAPTYETLIEPASGKPVAVFTVRMRDRKALARAVAVSMRHTFYAQKGENDYTQSVLQQGVKEPLTLFVVRVVYDDGSEDTFLVTGDGNSRLMSMWLARTGGDVEAAISACISSVIGSMDQSGARSRAEQGLARRRTAELTARTRKNLAVPALTEATRREGHTLAFPAVVVVGARADGGGPLADLVAARDDLLANLHVHVTPWTRGAQYTQGMQRVYRHALREGLISPEVYRVLSGTAGVQDMHELLGVPAYRLWSAAVHQHAVLAGPSAYAMNRLVKQEFGMSKADRQRVSERLAPMALSAYRSQDGIEQLLRAFGNGGTITDRVWKQPWELTLGGEGAEVLDDILGRALADEAGAVAELTVLGGTAAILDGYITRDRGSKEGTDRDSRTAPFRATPVSLLDVLSKTAGGLRMLHSIARAHIAADPTVLPKQFHTQDREIDGLLVHDGEPVLDKAGEQVIIDYEWDLVYAADPARALATIAKNGREPQELEAEDVRQRRLLTSGVVSAFEAARSLARMHKSRGPEVFGHVDTVDELREQLRQTEAILLRFGPSRSPFLLDIDEEGGE